MAKRKKRIPPFETEVVALGPKGVGVGVAPDGKPVHVRGAPPGGRVRVRPAGRRKGTWRGVRQELVRPPLDAVVPRCAVFGQCGGCTLQELSLAEQRRLKLARAKEEVGEADWRGVSGASAAYGYRNKVELTFGPRRHATDAEMLEAPDLTGRFLGMHAPGRFDRIVDAERCELLDEVGNAILALTRAHLLAEGAPAPYHPRAHEGVLRHLLIRRGSETSYVGLFTASPPETDVPAIEAWMAAVEALGNVSVGWFVHDGVADVARGSLRASRGPQSIAMKLAGRRFDLAPQAFFQVNDAGAEVLLERIAEALGTGHRLLLDLYCGTGSIGIVLAEHAERVLGIEVIPEAIDNARANAAANGVPAEYRVARVEDALGALAGGPGVAAVVDPPRAGLHPSVAEALARAPLEVLVYVACNPASLGRDRVVLERGGWRLERCWAVDLFPQTGHLEVVGRFVR